MNNKRNRVVLVLGILAIAAGLFFVRFKITEDTDVAVDFPSFYYASKLTFENGLTPYSASNWKLVGPLNTDAALFPFLYPPPSLLIFRPFVFLDYQTAQSLMVWLNHMLILVFIVLFFIKILGSKLDSLALLPAIVYLYLFNPLLITINNGQVNLWLLVSICLAWWGTKEKWHPFWIALPLAFGIILKVYPVLLLVIYLFKKEYKTILCVCAILIAFSAVATLILPEGIWQDWVSSVAARGYAKDIGGVITATPANQSINAFTTRLFYGRNVRFDPLLRPPVWADQAPYILSALVVLVSLAATWRLSREGLNDPEGLGVHFCVWILVAFLVAPFSWDHHLVHILPAIYLSVRYAHKSRNGPLLVLACVTALFLAYAFPSNDPFLRRGVWTLLISSQLFAVGLLWLYFIYLSLFRLSALPGRAPHPNPDNPRSANLATP